jgi:hypothetical protein
MNVGFNTQFSVIWVQQFIYLCEEENGQIIIIQGCVVFNMIVKKIKLKHPNLTSQILSECTYLYCPFPLRLYWGRKSSYLLISCPFVWVSEAMRRCNKSNFKSGWGGCTRSGLRFKFYKKKYLHLLSIYIYLYIYKITFTYT